MTEARTSKLGRAAALLAAVCLATGCPTDDPPLPAEGIFAPLGEILPTATPEQRATFERGREVTIRRFSVADGLGPHFNVSFCGACHEKPTFGGTSSHYRDFLLVGQELDDGSRVELGVNGVLPQFEAEVRSDLDSLPFCETVDGLPTDVRGMPPGSGATHAVTTRRRQDPRANHFATRNAIPFFGVGLIAELNEDAILANVDEDDRDGDGISGRPNFDRSFVGRFGRKSQTVSIEGFIRGPLFNHMGITSDPLSSSRKNQLPVPSGGDGPSTRRTAALSGDVGGLEQGQASAPDNPTTDDDGVCDPELSEQDLFDLVSFAMLLAAPEPDAPTEETLAGRATFDEIACVSCHVESLEGPRGTIPVFSDLLLHDMGPELADGVVMGRAGDPSGCPDSGPGCEWRTQPLWGVGAGGPFLHDGRADTIDAAIRMHGGEAAASRDAYIALSESARGQVLAFLNSLGGASQFTEGLLPPDAPVPGPGMEGGPEAALDAAQMQQFVDGRAVFDRDVPIAGGLGPSFNGDACRSCHFDPTIGGAGPVDLDVSRHGTVTGGVFAEPSGGTMAHRHGLPGAGRPYFDDLSNVIEARQTPSILGLGLLEGIPEANILALADPDDLDEDGISGVAHVRDDGRLGRFGWKGGVPSLAEFARDAMFNELGVTLPDQEGLSLGGGSDSDDIPDPEITVEELEQLTFFMANLAQPVGVSTDAAAEAAGETHFEATGCLDCHAVLDDADGMPVFAYTDLLLHDVQEDGFPGIADGVATQGQFRTPPLWGIRATAPYMHDGRAFTLEDAIASHAGEAEASRLAYEALSGAEREQLLQFLQSL